MAEKQRSLSTLNSDALLSKYYAIAILQIFQEVGVHRAVFEWPHHVRKREATYHAHILVLQEIL